MKAFIIPSEEQGWSDVSAIPSRQIRKHVKYSPIFVYVELFSFFCSTCIFFILPSILEVARNGCISLSLSLMRAQIFFFTAQHEVVNTFPIFFHAAPGFSDNDSLFFLVTWADTRPWRRKFLSCPNSLAEKSTEPVTRQSLSKFQSLKIGRSTIRM